MRSLPEGLDRFLFVPVPVIGGDANCELLISGGCWFCCVCCCCCDCCCCCCGLFAATCTLPGLAALSAIFFSFSLSLSPPFRFHGTVSLFLFSSFFSFPFQIFTTTFFSTARGMRNAIRMRSVRHTVSELDATSRCRTNRIRHTFSIISVCR